MLDSYDVFKTGEHSVCRSHLRFRAFHYADCGIHRQRCFSTGSASDDQVIAQVKFSLRESKAFAHIQYRDDLPVQVDHSQNHFWRLRQRGDLHHPNNAFDGK